MFHAPPPVRVRRTIGTETGTPHYASSTETGEGTPHYALGMGDTGPRHAFNAPGGQSPMPVSTAGMMPAPVSTAGMMPVPVSAAGMMPVPVSAAGMAFANASGEMGAPVTRLGQGMRRFHYGRGSEREGVYGEWVASDNSAIQRNNFFCWTQAIVLISFLGLFIGSLISLLEYVVFYWWPAVFIMLPLFFLLVIFQTAVYIIYLRSATSPGFSSSVSGVRTPHYYFGKPHFRELQTAVIATGILFFFMAWVLVDWVLSQNLPITFLEQPVPSGAEAKYNNMIRILFVIGGAGSYLLLRSMLAHFYPLVSLTHGWAVAEK